MMGRAGGVTWILCMIAVALGGATPARAATRHVTLVAVRSSPASTESRFASAVLDTARAQIALADVALARRPDASLAELATQARDVWLDVQTTLLDVTRTLHLSVPTALTVDEQLTLARFARLNDASFERAYVQAVGRGDRTTIGQMESLDGLVDQHVLFFADRELPHVLALQARVEAQSGR